MEGKTNFSKRLNQFYGLTRLTLTPYFRRLSEYQKRIADGFCLNILTLSDAIIFHPPEKNLSFFKLETECYSV